LHVLNFIYENDFEKGPILVNIFREVNRCGAGSLQERIFHVEEKNVRSKVIESMPNHRRFAGLKRANHEQGSVLHKRHLLPLAGDIHAGKESGDQLGGLLRVYQPWIELPDSVLYFYGKHNQF
jgi:hypothetical protein